MFASHTIFFRIIKNKTNSYSAPYNIFPPTGPGDSVVSDKYSFPRYLRMNKITFLKQDGYRHCKKLHGHMPAYPPSFIEKVKGRAPSSALATRPSQIRISQATLCSNPMYF